jgi:hypothetical protein
MCKNRARGFSARPRAIRLIATSSVFDEPGGMLMTTFFSVPSITRCTVSAISTWCQLTRNLIACRCLKKYRLKNR